MSTLQQLHDAIDGILEADEVTHPTEGEYLVRRPDSTVIRVRRYDRGDWTACFDSGLPMPHVPTHTRPNEIVVWSLL